MQWSIVYRCPETRARASSYETNHTHRLSQGHLLDNFVITSFYDQLLSQLYHDEPRCHCLDATHRETPEIPEAAIKRGYKVVLRAGEMTPEMLRERPIRRLISETASVYLQALDDHSIQYEIPHEMRQKLEQDIFLFSGFKTYHQLKEASELLLDERTGKLKSFNKFYQDVSQIRDKYNRHWLQAEYNYAIGASQEAAHWAEYQQDKEIAHLQYRTALDDKVRPDHAALEGVTLPVDDPFWDTAFPPNGWNCRCHVIPVPKEDYPLSNSQRAQDAFDEMTRGKDAIFRYNPGREGVIFPPHHPYYGKRGYKHCLNPHLATSLDDNLECEIYRNTNAPENLTLEKEIKELMEKEGKSEKAATRKAYSKTLKDNFYPASVAKELLLSTGELKEVNISFRGKGISHLINDILVGKCPSLSIDDLLYLDEHIAGAKQMSRRFGGLSKNRKDAIEYFYYLDADISGKQCVISLALEVVRGEHQVYPYSIYEKKS